MTIGIRILHCAPSPKGVCSQPVRVAPFAPFLPNGALDGSNVEGGVSTPPGPIVHRFGSALSRALPTPLGHLCACMWCKGWGDFGVLYHMKRARPILFFSFGWVHMRVGLHHHHEGPGARNSARGWGGGGWCVCVSMSMWIHSLVR